MPKVLVPIAQGFEEIELVSIVDILRRAGVDVTLASIASDDLLQEGAHCIKIVADTTLEKIQCNSFDGIVLAGGMQGVENMGKCQILLDLLQVFHQSKKLIGAICAAPIILDSLSLLQEDFCCYPGCEAMMSKTQAKRLQKGVHQQDHIITGMGPAFAMEFAIKLVAFLTNNEEQIRKELLI